MDDKKYMSLDDFCNIHVEKLMINFKKNYLLKFNQDFESYPVMNNYDIWLIRLSYYLNNLVDWL